MFSLVVVAKIKRKGKQDCKNQVIQRIHNEAKETRKRNKKTEKRKEGKELDTFSISSLSQFWYSIIWFCKEVSKEGCLEIFSA